MELEKLSGLEATKTEQESKDLIAAMLSNSEWVCYNKDWEHLTLYLTRRYLAAHARMPGKLISSVCGAENPLGIIRYSSNRFGLVEGAIFLNGAVVRMGKDNTEDLFLFISIKDAEFWDYPNSGKVFSVFDED